MTLFSFCFLWSLDRSWPHGSGEKASFSRPGPLSIFFLAQRPYLFQGTLREQVGNFSAKLFFLPFWLYFFKIHLNFPFFFRKADKLDMTSLDAGGLSHLGYLPADGAGYGHHGEALHRCQSVGCLGSQKADKQQLPWMFF